MVENLYFTLLYHIESLVSLLVCMRTRDQWLNDIHLLMQKQYHRHSKCNAPNLLKNFIETFSVSLFSFTRVGVVFSVSSLAGFFFQFGAKLCVEKQKELCQSFSNTLNNNHSPIDLCCFTALFLFSFRLFFLLALLLVFIVCHAFWRTSALAWHTKSTRANGREKKTKNIYE